MNGREPRMGASIDFLSDAERHDVLAQVLDYRGDVTLRLSDGSSRTGYVFSIESLAPEPHVKMMLADAVGERMSVPLARITGCEFSGRDTAWTRKYSVQ